MFNEKLPIVITNFIHQITLGSINFDRSNLGNNSLHFNLFYFAIKQISM